MHVDSPPARPENHQHSTNTRGDGVPSPRPSQLPKRKRATNTLTKLKSGVLPKKVTNRAAGSASALVPEPPSEYILEDDERIHITIASKYPYVEPEKEPEAAVFPKQPLSVKPPVWAEVGQVENHSPNHVGNMVSSHDRKCASPLTTSGAITAVFIM